MLDDYRKALIEKIPRAGETVKPNLLQNSVFIHMPKTGGTFIREHFNEQVGWWRQLGSGHGNLDDFPECANLFSFTFVRNPVDWLLSYWAFYRVVLQKNRAFGFQIRWAKRAIDHDAAWTEWIQLANPIELLWHADFDVFLARLLKHCPNAIDLAFEHFIKGVDFIGKTENLVPDIIKALELAGENMDFYKPEIIESWANDKRNVTNRDENFIYDEGLMSAILEQNPLIGEFYDSSVQD